MRKLIFFMHTSLDGFVAGLKGELNWVLGGNCTSKLTNKQKIENVVL